MRIALLAPKWDRSCEACKAYQYGTDGSLVRHPGTGEPQPRHPSIKTPCGNCPKPPAWAKKAGRDEDELRELAKPFDFTPANRAAYRFYQRCAGVGQFPDDDIVRWYSGLIRECEREQQGKPMDDMAKAVGSLCELIIATRK